MINACSEHHNCQIACRNSAMTSSMPPVITILTACLTFYADVCRGDYLFELSAYRCCIGSCRGIAAHGIGIGSDRGPWGHPRAIVDCRCCCRLPWRPYCCCSLSSTGCSSQAARQSRLGHHVIIPLTGGQMLSQCMTLFQYAFSAQCCVQGCCLALFTRVDAPADQGTCSISQPYMPCAIACSIWPVLSVCTTPNNV